MPFDNKLLKYIDTNNVFLETGTFKGETLNYIDSIFDSKKLISLELSKVFYNDCLKLFTNRNNIKIYNSNSKYDLYKIIKDIDSSITFWLDSHWSGTPDVGCDIETVCPILEELEQIAKHKIKTHTIMIDDIRLMNNSLNKYEGFPIKIDEIVSKIYEINPNYKIKYYDDYITSKDILVAYIENKICIHKYLTNCTSNPQPPGFADFLRGSITLYNLSQKNGHTLLFDNGHPLFKFLEKNDKIIENSYTSKTIELLPPLSYQTIYNKLDIIFNSFNIPFTVMTNSFYINKKDNTLSNWGEITDECAEYFKNILKPSLELDNKVKYVIQSVYNINNGEQFKSIHLRFGDRFIHNNEYDEYLFNLYEKKITDIVNRDKDNKYVLITDSSLIGNKLHKGIKNLCYYDNKKIHMGDLIHCDLEEALFDTLTDFFILSKSNEIISIGSGFSIVVSKIYNIKYSNLTI